MNKNEIFALNLRALGWEGTDQEFSDLACYLRMAIRLGVLFTDMHVGLAADVASQVWAGMLDKRTYALLN